jgi:hypothetical protein
MGKENEISARDRIWIFIITTTIVSTMHIQDFKNRKSGSRIGCNTAAVLWGCFVLHAFGLIYSALDVDCDPVVEAFRFELYDLPFLGSNNCSKASLETPEALERSGVEALVLLACQSLCSISIK